MHRPPKLDARFADLLQSLAALACLASPLYRPPPTAYHSASPMNGGEVVVFLVGIDKGPETLLSSSVFLLDTTVGDGMAWSSFPVAGLLGRRMHSAISVTAIGTQR